MNIPTLVDHDAFTEIFDKVIDKAEDGIVIVEVGVLVGGTVCYFSQKLQEKGITHTIIAIDNFKFDTINGGDVIKYTNGQSPYIAYNNNLRKAKAKVMTFIGDSIDVSKLFKDESIDFLFLDGDHTAPYVVEELKSWLPKMKPDSMIAGHDFLNSPDVQIACTLILKNVETTSTKSSYFKQIGEGVMGKKKEKDKEPKLGWIRFLS